MKKVLLSLTVLCATVLGLKTTEAAVLKLEDVNTTGTTINAYIVGNRVYDLNTYVITIKDVTEASAEYALANGGADAPVYYLYDSNDGLKMLEIVGKYDEKTGNVPTEEIDVETKYANGKILGVTRLNDVILTEYRYYVGEEYTSVVVGINNTPTAPTVSLDGYEFVEWIKGEDSNEDYIRYDAKLLEIINSEDLVKDAIASSNKYDTTYDSGEVTINLTEGFTLASNVSGTGLGTTLKNILDNEKVSEVTIAVGDEMTYLTKDSDLLFELKNLVEKLSGKEITSTLVQDLMDKSFTVKIELNDEYTDNSPYESYTILLAGNKETSVEVSNAKELEIALSSSEITEITLTSNLTLTNSITVDEGRVLTIDLGTYSISNDADHTILNNGTLTITGSTGSLTNTALNKAVIYNNGVLTINGGNFYRDDNAAGNNGYYVLLNHGTTTINDGSFSISGGVSSLIDNGWYTPSQNIDKEYSYLYINGGTFTVEGNNDKYIKNDDYGIMEILDGNFYMKDPASAIVASVGSAGGEEYVTINGGYYYYSGANYAIWDYIYEYYDKQTVSINGGEFILTNGTATITNLKNVDDVTLTYEVTNADELDNVLANASAGATIVLSKDTSYNALTITKDVIINGNGATVGAITVSGDEVQNVTINNVTTSERVNVLAGNVTLQNITISDISSTYSNKSGSGSIITVNTTGSFVLANSSISTSGEGVFYNAVRIDNADSVKIDGNTFGEISNVYNAIEFGQSYFIKDGTVIINNNFNSQCSNNVISMFNFDEDATVTIEGNYFVFSGNAVRISNYTNTNATINLIDNEYDDTNSNDWAGFVIFQGVHEGETFAGITVNVTNLIGPDDTPINSLELTGKLTFCYYYGDKYPNKVMPEDTYATINFID